MSTPTAKPPLAAVTEQIEQLVVANLAARPVGGDIVRAHVAKRSLI